MNNNTKRKNKINRKQGNYFHGQPCDTGFGSKLNKNRQPKKYPKIK